MLINAINFQVCLLPGQVLTVLSAGGIVSELIMSEPGALLSATTEVFKGSSLYEIRPGFINNRRRGDATSMV